jgi:hypothetical protein
MGSLSLFIADVAAHLVALMSGIASFIIAGIEAFRQKPLVARCFWIAGGVCLLVAFDQAWQDEHRNALAAIADKAAVTGLANSCAQDSRVAQTYLRGVEGLNFEQRQTIDNLELVNGKQQSAVNSCVVSLGKLNPRVNLKTAVLYIPVGSNISPGVGRLAPPVRLNVGVLVISTNQRTEPLGRLECTGPFNPSTPEIPMIKGQMASFNAGSSATRISDREYEIRVSQMGSEWGPTTPLYMLVQTTNESLGACTFQAE